MPISATDLVSPGHGVVLPLPGEPGEGKSVEFSDLGRVRLRASANKHVSPEGEPSLTVIVEDSGNGTSGWATIATFVFGADGEQTADVAKPRAFLRASWSVDSGSWAAPKAVATPLASTLPSVTETDGVVSLDAVLALGVIDAPTNPASGWVVWADADGNVYAKNPAGTTRTLAARA